MMDVGTITVRQACLEILEREVFIRSFIHIATSCDSIGFISSFDYIVENEDCVFGKEKIEYKTIGNGSSWAIQGIYCVIASLISKFEDMSMPELYISEDDEFDTSEQEELAKYIMSRTNILGEIIPESFPDTEFTPKDDILLLMENAACRFEREDNDNNKVEVLSSYMSKFVQYRNIYTRSNATSKILFPDTDNIFGNMRTEEILGRKSIVTPKEFSELFGGPTSCEYTFTRGRRAGSKCGVKVYGKNIYCKFCSKKAVISSMNSIKGEDPSRESNERKIVIMFHKFVLDNVINL